MKVSFLFNADHPDFDGFYGEPIYEKVFAAIRRQGRLSLSSQIFVGDIFLHTHYNENTKTRFYQSFILDSSNWMQFLKARFNNIFVNNIFAVCLDNIEREDAETIYYYLMAFEPFIGAIQVVPTNHTHSLLFEKTLISFGVIDGDKLKYNQNTDEDLQALALRAGFFSVEFAEEEDW